ncbi:MAG: preprotein translocase subunit SecE [Oscillatoriales cyanobacterium SM2_2_1]|nr:preprotein translocase subunit SecE [Oscillatoriales cyanobacterium SM2_2_1]
MTKSNTDTVSSKTAEGNSSQVAPLLRFFGDTRSELGKIVWPKREQLFNESAAVLLMVVVSSTFVYLINQLFGWIALQVFR